MSLVDGGLYAGAWYHYRIDAPPDVVVAEDAADCGVSPEADFVVEEALCEMQVELENRSGGGLVVLVA